MLVRPYLLIISAAELDLEPRVRPHGELAFQLFDLVRVSTLERLDLLQAYALVERALEIGLHVLHLHLQVRDLASKSVGYFRVLCLDLTNSFSGSGFCLCGNCVLLVL